MWFYSTLDKGLPSASSAQVTISKLGNKNPLGLESLSLLCCLGRIAEFLAF